MFLRFLDLSLALAGMVLTAPVILLIFIIGVFDTGSPIFTQRRVGYRMKPFVLVKFRTMAVDTASVASHLASSASVTRVGIFLRRTKLDELPQLWNVLKGDMSLVGPRPNLFNQEELINERQARGVYDVRPGITGLAQIDNIDMSTPKLLAETDSIMIKNMCVRVYFYYILRTLMGAGNGDSVGK